MHGTRWLRIVPLRLHSLVRRHRVEDDLEEELRFHLEQERLADRRARVSPIELQRCKDECRDARGLRWLDEAAQDLRAAIRALRKSPAFSALAVSMLGIALAAVALVCSYLDALLVRPLPYGTAEKRLVLLWEQFGGQDLDRVPFSAPEVNDLQDGAEVFEDAAAFRHTEFNVTSSDGPERIYASVVSWNLFSVLGTSPSLGRAFTVDDEGDHASPVVLISDSLWKRHFASDPTIVGREILLSGRPHRVLGVMPESFRFPLPLFGVRGPVPGRAEIWKPIRTAERLTSERSSRTYGVVARLRSNAQVHDATVALSRLSGRWCEQYPANYRSGNFHLRAHALREEVVGRARPAVVAAAAAAFVLLLIAFANLIALLLARAHVREHELAIRSALGAGSGRLFRQMLTEGLLLGWSGGVVGLLVAAVAISTWPLMSGEGVAMPIELQLGMRVPLYIAVLSLIAGIVVGGVPARAIVRRASAHGLSCSLHAVRTMRAWERLRDALVIIECALAVVLLVPAGLLARSYIRLHETPLGFDPHSVMTAEISLAGLRYPSPEAVADFYANADLALAAIPNAAASGFVSVLPLSGIKTDKSFTLEGESPTLHVGDEEFRVVTAGYFEAMRMPLVRGRFFSRADGNPAQQVAIVNEAFARRYWPAGDALGQRIKLNERANAPWREIIGIVGDVRHNGLHEMPRPEFYVPHAQMPTRLMALVLRTDRSAAEMLRDVRAELRILDPEQPLANVRAMDRVIADSIAHRRLVLWLVSSFAVVALFFGAAGLHAVLSSTFVARQRELAMRIALGASQRDMLRLVFKKSLLLLTTGLSFGLPLSVLASHGLRSLLHGVSPYDAINLLNVLATLCAAVFIATIMPARRAARLNAAELLRAD